MKQKGSSDAKGSLWNHLDKNVILWHTFIFKSVIYFSDGKAGFSTAITLVFSISRSLK